ncbi:protein kinase domain-containing protein [Nocardia takedensis]
MGDTRFGRYRLERLLGKGGMGQVWLARDPDGTRVALKLLPVHLAADDEFRTRFEREAELATALRDPHLVPIHRHGEVDGRLFIEMDYVEGVDLGARIAESGRLEPRAAVAIIVQIAAALDAAHRVGLVHRDVKPSNILVRPDGYAYLIDFGIARREGEAGVTAAGMAIGTWAYMAPERFSGVSDPRTDIYSLACVTYECLTGRRPHGDTDPAQQMRGHLLLDPALPSAANSAIPATLDLIVVRGMAKDPAERPGTAGEFARAACVALGMPALPSAAPTSVPPAATPSPVPPAAVRTPVPPAAASPPAAPTPASPAAPSSSVPPAAGSSPVPPAAAPTPAPPPAAPTPTKVLPEPGPPPTRVETLLHPPAAPSPTPGRPGRVEPASYPVTPGPEGSAYPAAGRGGRPSVGSHPGVAGRSAAGRGGQAAAGNHPGAAAYPVVRPAPSARPGPARPATPPARPPATKPPSAPANRGWARRAGWKRPPPPPPRRRRKRGGVLSKVIGALTVIFLAPFAFAAGCFALIATGTSTSDDTAAPPPAVTEANQPPPWDSVDTPAPAGTAVRDGKFEFAVTGVEFGVSRIGMQSAQGSFVVVGLDVRNISEEKKWFLPFGQKLVDGADRVVEHDTTATAWQNVRHGNNYSFELAPGQSVRTQLVFDVPADLTPDHLELHDFVWSGGVAVRL